MSISGNVIFVGDTRPRVRCKAPARCITTECSSTESSPVAPGKHNPARDDDDDYSTVSEASSQTEVLPDDSDDSDDSDDAVDASPSPPGGVP